MSFLRLLVLVTLVGWLLSAARALTRRFGSGSAVDQGVSAGIVSLFTALVVLRTLGHLSILEAPAIVVAVSISGAGLFWLAGARTARDALALAWSVPADSEARADRIARIGSRVALGACVGLLLLQGWLFRTTAWDSLWYHVVMTHEYVTRASTAWRDSGIPYVVGYPNAVELLTAGICAITGTTQLDDVGQIPFGLTGAALVVAWARRTGAPRAVATCAAALWFAMPPVFLQMTSNLNDVAYAVALGATFYFLFAAPDSPLRSWLVLMSAGLVLACKGSGLVHIGVLSPLLVWDQVRAIGSDRIGRVPSFLARAALLVWVGFYRAIENVIHTGNPGWPMQVRVRALGLELDGPIDPASVRWNGMHGLDSYFFTGPGDFTRMLRTWFDLDPPYEPNVAGGGFGPVHAFLGLPALALGLGMIARARPRVRGPALAAYALFAFGLTGPSPWIPRFVLAASIASMIVLALVLGRMRRPVRWSALVLAFALASGSLVRAIQVGIHSWGEHGLLAVLQRPPEERAALPVGDLWPTWVTRLRDETFELDDAVAYDADAWLVGQYYPWNYGSRLVWVEAEGRGEEYLARLRSNGARWVVLPRGSRQARELEALGAAPVHQTANDVTLRLPEADHGAGARVGRHERPDDAH